VHGQDFVAKLLRADVMQFDDPRRDAQRHLSAMAPVTA